MNPPIRTSLSHLLIALSFVPAGSALAQLPLETGQYLNIPVGMSLRLVQVLEVRGQWFRVTHQACKGLDRNGVAKPDSCWINSAHIQRFIPLTPGDAPAPERSNKQ